jgi:acetyltransferase
LERRHPLDALFAPKTIAVIGATEKPGSVGRALFQNLQAFGGTVYPVNPKHPSVLGRKAFANLAAVPEKVDLAVLVTPAPSVPGLVRECVEAGVAGAIIISAGFKEVGPAGAEMEGQILAEAQRGKMRIIGPNCLGVMVPHASFNATFATRLARPGSLAFISQSGALCTAILDWSLRENVGFSAFVSVGSMLDVGWGDLIYYLGDDPQTKSIVMYMESVGDARAFLSAAREVALVKPIIVIKVGRTEAAAKAAASHTGSLTGSDEVLDAAFRRVGVLRVNSIEELFDMAEVLGKQPRPQGPRLTILTNAGGPGALATDLLIGSGGQLAELPPDIFAAFNKLLPPHWSRNNPVDILGDAGPERYRKAAEIALKNPNSDGLLIILTPQAMTDPIGTAAELKTLTQHPNHPMLSSWMGGQEVEAGRDILNRADIPTFDYPDIAARAFTYMWRYSSNLRSLYETPSLTAESEGGTTIRHRMDKLLQPARDARRSILTEYESKRMLQAYDIPTVETHVARSEDEAVALARRVGFPAVLKLFSETITHKTDVGGVHLNLPDELAVRRAWRAIQASVAQKSAPEHFQGVTVQPMVSLDGYELILGSSIDPQFGPVLLFGAGGQLVEVFKDRALGLPPLNATLARRMMEQTRIYKALQGVRGRPPVDLAQLERLLVRFSQLVAEQRWISEIDINPLLVGAEGMIALDARVVLHGPDVTEDRLPRPAIRPYPVQYMTRQTTKDGQAVIIRPIRPEDEPLMVRFHSNLSERSVYYRYFTPLRLEQRTAHERLTRICFIDYDREMALVAEHKSEPASLREIVGVGRLIKMHGRNEAEFAIVVSDPWQGRGLGTELLKLLVQIGRDEKIQRIVGHILPDNREMLAVCRKVGFEVQQAQGQGECRAELVL